MSLLNRSPILALLLFVSILVAAGDMTVTLDDGRDVFLHEDSTWSFKMPPVNPIAEDITLTLNDGRTLALLQDGSYKIGRNLKFRKRATLKLSDLSATVTASKISLTQSRAAAKEMIIANLSARVKKELGDPSIPAPIITGCVRGQLDDNKLETAIVNSNGVKMSITLSRQELQDLAQCIEDHRDDGARNDTVKQDTAKKARK
jgi:hypothetical protein